jgi:hypothetical protein
MMLVSAANCSDNLVLIAVSCCVLYVLLQLCDELDNEKKIVLVPVVEQERGTVYQPHQVCC